MAVKTNGLIALGCLALAVSAAALTACSSGADVSDETNETQELRTTAAPTQALIAIGAQTWGDNSGYAPPPASAESLRRMIEWHRYAVVGQVMSDAGLFLYSETEPYTGYTLRIDDVISGTGLTAGEEILMVVPGGQRPNGAIKPQYGLPVKVGARYLLFMHDWPTYSPGFPGFLGEVIARFEVSGDDRIIPNGFELYPGVQELSGVSTEDVLAARHSEDPATALAKLAHVTLAEAVDKIKASVALGSIPEWPPEWSGLRDLYPKPTPIAAAPESPAAPTPAPSQVTPAPSPVSTPKPINTPAPLASP